MRSTRKTPQHLARMIRTIGLAQHFSIEHHRGISADNNAQAYRVFSQNILNYRTSLALCKLLYRFRGLRALVRIKRFVHFGGTGIHRKLNASFFKQLLSAWAVRSQDDIYGNSGCIGHVILLLGQSGT